MPADPEPQVVESGHKVILHIVVMAIVSAPILVLKLAVAPIKRGFYCGDKTINQPYNADTVPLGALIGVAAVLFCVCVPVVELLIYCQNKKAAVVTDEKTTVLVTVFGCHIHPYLAAVCQEVGAVCFGAAVCQLITDIAKYSVGRLRPHFLDVCKPNWSAFSCTNAFGNMKYLQDYVCTQTDRKLLKEARLSFPSGHASFSIYTTIYAIVYLQMKLTWHWPKYFLQAMLVCLAFYTCQSRVSDFKHHLTDVIGGFFIGATVGILSARHMSKLWRRKSYKPAKVRNF